MSQKHNLRYALVVCDQDMVYTHLLYLLNLASNQLLIQRAHSIRRQMNREVRPPDAVFIALERNRVRTIDYVQRTYPRAKVLVLQSRPNRSRSRMQGTDGTIFLDAKSLALNDILRELLPESELSKINFICPANAIRVSGFTPHEQVVMELISGATANLALHDIYAAIGQHLNINLGTVRKYHRNARLKLAAEGYSSTIGASRR